MKMLEMKGLKNILTLTICFMVQNIVLAQDQLNKVKEALDSGKTTFIDTVLSFMDYVLIIAVVLAAVAYIGDSNHTKKAVIAVVVIGICYGVLILLK